MFRASVIALTESALQRYGVNQNAVTVVPFTLTGWRGWFWRFDYPTVERGFSDPQQVMVSSSPIAQE